MSGPFPPTPMACVGCGVVTTHEHSHDLEDREVVIQWYRCTGCGLLRSLDPVWLDEDEDLLAALSRRAGRELDLVGGDG